MSTPVTTNLTLVEDPPLVCRITPDGDVQCEKARTVDPWPSDHMEQTRLLDNAESMVHGEWNKEKMELWLALGRAIVSTGLSDARIAKRSSFIARAVEHLLINDTPPSVVLFNFSRLPGDVMGAYYHATADYVRMTTIPPLFANPVQDA